MPEMDGLEASKRIQETYKPEERPRIIALSADTVQVSSAFPQFLPYVFAVLACYCSFLLPHDRDAAPCFTIRSTNAHPPWASSLSFWPGGIHMLTRVRCAVCCRRCTTAAARLASRRSWSSRSASRTWHVSCARTTGCSAGRAMLRPGGHLTGAWQPKLLPTKRPPEQAEWVGIKGRVQGVQVQGGGEEAL